MGNKYNLWATKDMVNYFSPFVNILDGGNQFDTIADTQNEVESQLGVELDWITPQDTRLYDPVYDYLIHGSGSPDSYAELNGIRYTITQIVDRVPLEKALPTIESLIYALKKGDYGHSDEGIINRILWLKSNGEYGCPGVGAVSCKHYNRDGKFYKPQCYINCPTKKESGK
jgi:hypothetical protein